MPIYDYRCDHCGHVFSQVQSFHDSALEICPNCGKRPRRLITAPAIVFKGSGWYKTDSRAPSATEKAERAEAKTASEKSEKAEKAATKTETKAETKSAAKTDAKHEASAPAKSEPSSTGSKGEAAS